MEDNSEEVKSELVVSQKDVERFLELTTYYQKMQEPIKADADMNVTFNEEAVRAWMRDFGKTYDTVGTTRTITSPTGKTVEVSGGTLRLVDRRRGRNAEFDRKY